MIRATAQNLFQYWVEWKFETPYDFHSRWNSIFSIPNIPCLDTVPSDITIKTHEFTFQYTSFRPKYIQQFLHQQGSLQHPHTPTPTFTGIQTKHRQAKQVPTNKFLIATGVGKYHTKRPPAFQGPNYRPLKAL